MKKRRAPRVIVAVCVACGATKDRPMGSCPACGHRPEGEDRLAAWLFSAHHLTQEELQDASERLVGGERLDPSPEMLAVARAALNPVPEARDPLARDPDERLSPRWIALLLACNVVFTPLFGFTAWWSWRSHRPQAARQALHLTWPVAVALVTAWVLTMLRT